MTTTTQDILQIEHDAERAVSCAKTRLILTKDAKSVFFASLVLRFKIESCWTIKTADVDGRTLRYNPEFVLSLTEPRLIGLLAHEVLHCTNKHFARLNGRDRNTFNIAADLAINDILKDSGFQLPPNGCFVGQGSYKDFPAGLSAEEYYAKLTETNEEDGKGQPTETDSEDQTEDDRQDEQSKTGNDNEQDSNESNEPGDGDTENDGESEGQGQPDKTDSEDPGQCGGFRAPSNEDGTPTDTADQKQLDQEWNANIAAAQQAAERRGELPGELVRHITAVLAPDVDWKNALREYITRAAKDGFDWKRPNRRFAHSGVYLPSRRSLEIGHIIAVIDTSGSIGEETLNRFASELADIAEIGVSKITTLYHDSAIVRVDEWTPEDGPYSVTPCGGGGTDHRPVFDWIESADLEAPPALVVLLTDLWSTFPDHAPVYPVLWASTCQSKSHPFGDRIDIPSE